MTRTLYIDLGANNGDTIATELASSRVDYCWGFEPNPDLSAKLRDRFRHAPVEIVEAAAWTQDGTQLLYLGHPLSSTLLSGKVTLPDYPQFAITYDRSVPVKTIDIVKWLGENIEPDDQVTLKMDIEGAEYQVLPALLESTVIDRIAELRCEFHPERFPLASKNHSELVEALEARTHLVLWQ